MELLVAVNTRGVEAPQLMQARLLTEGLLAEVNLASVIETAFLQLGIAKRT